jgi:orotate phosphoribosyltransferase
MVVSSRSTQLYNDILAAGFISEGHFAFRSGMHALKLLDRDRLLSDPNLASRMGYALAKHFFLLRVDFVATPSIWGAGLAQWVGYFLEPKRPIVYSTMKDGEIVFSTGSETLDGKRVLVIDNLILTGGTMTEFVRSLTAAEATPIAVGALADLSGVDFPIQTFGLLNDQLDVFDPKANPEIGADIPVTEVPY